MNPLEKSHFASVVPFSVGKNGCAASEVLVVSAARGTVGT